MRMIVNRPAAVAAAFSKSCRPISPGERFAAAIPEPITIAARKAEPRNSANRRRGRGACAVSGSGRAGGGPQLREQCIDPRRGLVAYASDRLEALAGGILELPVLV